MEFSANEYLSRLGLEPDNLDAGEETLRILQRRHLMTVPFENLDIHWDRPISLNVERFYRKVVIERRGGFCYELNGLFEQLLRAMGFETRMVSARVFHDDGSIGPEFDHAAIIVTVGEDEYLADVGFGDFTTEPLRFSLGAEQHDASGVFVIRQFDNVYFEVAKREGDVWKGEYSFQDVGHDLSDFAEMCDFQQHSPNSHFTKGRICSILTEDGRKTLTDKKYLVTLSGSKFENDISSEAEFDDVLQREFSIKPSNVTERV